MRRPRELMDYVVDAQSGKVVAELPRTSSVASNAETEVDRPGKLRQFRAETNGSRKILNDTVLAVQTFDFEFGDPEVDEGKLPGRAIVSPPGWQPSSVSAHYNASTVAQFLREVLQRNNIDNNGGPLISSINCVVMRESRDGRQWFNAFWNSRQIVYGQRFNGNTCRLISTWLDMNCSMV